MDSKLALKVNKFIHEQCIDGTPHDIGWNVVKLIEAETQVKLFCQPHVSGSLPSDDVPLTIWANIYNPIKPNSWDLYHTENGAVINAIGGVKTHCYIHESILGNDR